jgi:hypothetical protein
VPGAAKGGAWPLQAAVTAWRLVRDKGNVGVDNGAAGQPQGLNLGGRIEACWKLGEWSRQCREGADSSLCTP